MLVFRNRVQFIPKVSLLLLLSSIAQAQLHGTIKPTPRGNCKQPTEVFISTPKKELLYQIHAPVGGDFEVKLPSGKYSVIATNKEGCLAEKDVVLAGRQIDLDLTLVLPNVDVEEKTPKEAGAPDKQNQRRMPAMGAQPGWNCPQCQMNALGSGQYNPFSQMAAPWWYYGWNPYFVNMSYPCMWGGWGCSGGYYPPGGPIAMGKPNIYVTGPNRKGLYISVVGDTMKGLMATAPAHLEKGWKLDYSDGKIWKNGVEIPYLFYDARTTGKFLQSKAGFCGARQVVLDQMTGTLLTLKFPERAIRDFQEHWAHKFPPIKGGFCVFPQTETEMDKEVPLKTNSDGLWTRVLFLALPEKGLPKTLPKALAPFFQKPQEAWVASTTERQPSSDDMHFYEWGVAFPFQ